MPEQFTTSKFVLRVHADPKSDSPIEHIDIGFKKDMTEQELIFVRANVFSDLFESSLGEDMNYIETKHIPVQGQDELPLNPSNTNKGKD